MTEDRNPRVLSNDSSNNDAAQTRQRKRRKWDQPAESLVSAGVTLPLGNMGSLGGVLLPGIVPPVSGAILTNPLAASCTSIPTVLQTSSFQQNTVAVVPKVNQSNKIQDELIIAREIVINDAESSVRYKLTKCQTQKEIQKCTGAVVITRGRFRPAGAPPDGEKPLYLHISAGAHLKDTAERILAVDCAAAMVEEMLKQSQSLQPALLTFSDGQKVTQPLSTCVYLGFDADPSLNIGARIRGPNDQYINHIMNETGATVLLRGQGSGNSESLPGEVAEVHQPLHLFLSSNNPKSLEDAKHLAEHLLDTISKECGASRVSSTKVYGAVPPPQQLFTGINSVGHEQNLNASLGTGLTSAMCSTPVAASSVIVPAVASVFTRGMVNPAGGFVSCRLAHPNVASYTQPILSGGTSYTGYDGIYPQATPLQQVALALRQAPAPVNSTVPPTASMANTASTSATNLGTSSTSGEEKQPPQRRKFQELPSSVKGAANPHQGLLKPSELTIGLGERNMATMPPPELVQPCNGMVSPPPPPPSRTLSQPPLPPKFTSSSSAPPPPKFNSLSSPPKTVSQLPPTPKFTSSTSPSTAMSQLHHPPKLTSSTATAKLHDETNSLNKPRSGTIPDTLIKLMEYGDEDDDLEEDNEAVSNNSNTADFQKPFWAV